MYGLGAAIAWSGLPVTQKGGIPPGGRVATGGAFDANAIRILGLSPAYRPPVLKSPTTPSVTCWNGIKYYGAGATCPPKPLPPSSTPSAPPSGTSPINPPVVVDTGAAAGGGLIGEVPDGGADGVEDGGNGFGGQVAPAP